ncbi:MAG: S1 RNA-binding domain-containing protein [Kiritimatiellia bacterium]
MNDDKVTMSDFENLLDQQLSGYRGGFDPGEQVQGVVIEITSEFVVLDVNAKREAMISIDEMMRDDGTLRVETGDTVDAFFSGMSNGAFLFTSRISSRSAVDRTLIDAYDRRMPVEGKVEKEINGGYEVRLNGQRAFCPYSQINLYRQDDAVYVGKTFMFMIAEYDQDDRGTNVIVSRRLLMEREREAQREELIEDLYEGMIAPGTVTRIMDFGVFVDLGGAEGLIPLRELSWKRDAEAEEIVKPGDKVDVEIRSLDWDANRISLSLRGAQGDPWEKTIAKYPSGSFCTGTVTRVERYGAFAEIEPGVEGLVPVSRLGNGRRLMSAREVVSEGQKLDLQVGEIDSDRRRISLYPVDLRIRDLAPGELTGGMKVEGIVESVQNFGVFIRLSEEKTGLLHISETGIPRGGNSLAKMEKMFPLSEKIELVVKSVDGDRISLTTPSKWDAQGSEDGAVKLSDWKKSNHSHSLGSLGNAFEGLDL